jgi:Asp-tRNA(Asn)/Glu-tRNA(Gln) amidotransferase A subunit family amidase
MAGRDDKDPNTLRQPAPRLDDLGQRSLAGVRIGLYRPWFEDAEAEVVRACRGVLDGLQAAGATVVDIEVPELALLRTVHLITIIAEMASSHSTYYDEHRTDYGLDVRLSLAVARRLSAFDYINAQRHRARLCAHFDRILERVDVIVTPTTARTAPVLPLDALETGESNVEVTDQIMRYATPGNLTGLPAISWLAGYDGNGLPIGFQAMGRAWEEHLLLRLAMIGEGLVRRRKPRVHHRLLTRT